MEDSAFGDATASVEGDKTLVDGCAACVLDS